MKDFLTAIERRNRPVADIEQEPYFDGLVHFGQPVDEAGAFLVWDPTQGRVVGDGGQLPVAPALSRSVVPPAGPAS